MRVFLSLFTILVLQFSGFVAYGQTCPSCPPNAGTPICPLIFEGTKPVPTWVSGCVASVVSDWNEGLKSEFCSASVPQGSALINTRDAVVSSHNGYYSLSRLTAGSFKYTDQIDEVYKGMFEAAATFGDTNYALKIKAEWDKHRNIAIQWEGTSDTAKVTVSAKGSGDWWDRWRGWQTVRVDLEVICLAPANLREQLEKTLGFNQFVVKSPQYVAIENNTGAKVFGLVQALPEPKTNCADAAGPSSGFEVEKLIQKNFRINTDQAGQVKNAGLCVFFGKTAEPGFADFAKACLLKPAMLNQIGTVPVTCFAN